MSKVVQVIGGVLIAGLSMAAGWVAKSWADRPVKQKMKDDVEKANADFMALLKTFEMTTEKMEFIVARASDESITNAEELREFLKAYGLNDIQANRVVQLRFPGEQQRAA